MNKIIFLDIDGVLINTFPAWKSDELDTDGYSKFNENNVANLKQLLAEFSDWHIAITSSRRIGKSLERLEEIFSFRGLGNRIVDKIPDPETTHLSRALEISNYISEKNSHQFIIIDDDKSVLTMDEMFLPYVVLTEYRRGFDSANLELAQNILRQLDGKDNSEYWKNIEQQFNKSESLINLNSAGISPSPLTVIQEVHKINLLINEIPSFHTWQTFEERKKSIREQLASFAGVQATEIAIMRNATEALTNIIFGLSLVENDEIILSKYDYPSVINAWKQREIRDKIKLVWVDLAIPSENEAALTETYTSKFTPRTRLVHITHIINWNGQIMPVKKIADAAKSQQIEVIIDGSQSFALLDYKISDLNCDYFCTSLHKWLNAPIGTGLLYIRKDKIVNVYPLMGNKKPLGNDIRKFESYGIRNIVNELGIGFSLDFHLSIGTERKRQRLFELKNLWVNALKDIEKVTFFTPFSPHWSCSIGTFHIEGYTSRELVKILLDKYKIHVTTADKEAIKGIRVTPSIATTEEEIYTFIRAIKEIVETAP